MQRNGRFLGNVWMFWEQVRLDEHMLDVVGFIYFGPVLLEYWSLGGSFHRSFYWWSK